MSTKDTELGLFRSIIQWIHYLFVREYIPSFCEITELVDGYGFTYPVIVKVTQSKRDLFIATCPMFNLYTEGKTFDEALNNIKSLIVDDYLAFQKDYHEDPSYIIATRSIGVEWDETLVITNEMFKSNRADTKVITDFLNKYGIQYEGKPSGLLSSFYG